MAVRTIVSRAIADNVSSFKDTRKIFVANANRRVGFIVFQEYVVSGLVFLDEVVFQLKGVFFGLYHDISDISNLAHQ